MKDKFDNWLISLDQYNVTSNCFFLLAVLNLWNIVYLVLFIFLGILWRYAGIKHKNNKKKFMEIKKKIENIESQNNNG